MSAHWWQAFRVLVKYPSFAASVVLVLSISIGASSAVFGLVSSILLRPLPLPESERLIVLWESNGGRRNAVAPGNFHDWKRIANSFEEMVAFTRWSPVITGTDSNETLRGVRVTEGFFSLARVSPFVGSGLRTDQGEVVISYGLWQRRFGGDSGVLGKRLMLRELNGEERPYAIVGVMPAGFHFPSPLTSDLVEVWSRLPLAGSEGSRKGRNLNVMARLKPGVALQEAATEMKIVGERLESEYPATNKGWGIEQASLHEAIVGNVRPSLLMLLAAVLCLQLIACANVANLYLARTINRTRELAIRSALGAGRLQLVKHVLTETLLFSLLGGAAGVLLAWWSSSVAVSFASQDILRLGDSNISWMTLVFALAVSTLSALLIGLVPAWSSSNVKPMLVLRDSSSSSARGLFWQMRRFLGVSQIALAVTLLVGSGLLLKSFARLQSISTRGDMADILAFEVALPGSRYLEFQKRRFFFDQLVERIQALNEVVQVAAVSSRPYRREFHFGVSRIDEASPSEGLESKSEVREVKGDLLQTLGWSLVQGRPFQRLGTLTDVVPEAIANQTLARQLWGEESPLGRRIKIQHEGQFYELVGILADQPKFGMLGDVEPEVYINRSDLPSAGMTILVRTSRTPPLRVVKPIREILNQMDDQLALDNAATLEEIWFDSFARPQFQVVALGVFAIFATGLATIGVYGLVSYLIAGQTREIGLRMALGAGKARTMAGVCAQGLKLSGFGVAIGIVAAIALNGVLKHTLYGVSSLDPLTFILGGLLILLASLLASGIPAWRAQRIDPATMLRSQ